MNQFESTYLIVVGGHTIVALLYVRLFGVEKSVFNTGRIKLWLWD
jgi:hypothetical protein